MRENDRSVQSGGNIFTAVTYQRGSAVMNRSRRILFLLVSSSMILALLQGGCATEQVLAQPPAPAVPMPAPVPPQPSGDLEQLVAPIALYPDALIAQILAAAAHPTEIVEANRWLRQHPELKGGALAEAVDAQPWDAGVKAVTQFPALLGMMDKNLSWTSALGEAYVNGPQNVLDTVQVMRQRAQRAGNLRNTPQESITTEDGTISIEPADPQVVYVPEYDPWLVYGDPLAFYPGWFEAPGVFIDGPGIEFGAGIGIGLFGGFGWGWHGWGTDWHGHHLIHGHHPYDPHSREFGNRAGFGRERAGSVHSGGYPGVPPRGDSFDRAGAGWATHGGSASGIHSGAFSGFNHGSDARTFSSRGRASFGGGFHGGSFHGGGGHR
jgi:hypothetical protein